MWRREVWKQSQTSVNVHPHVSGLSVGKEEIRLSRWHVRLHFQIVGMSSQALPSYMARVLLVPLVNSAMKRQPTKLFLFLLTASDWRRTFHTAAFVVLCIVLIARTVLVSHQCFGYCCAVLAQHEGSISSSAPLLQPKVSKLGVGKTKLTKRLFHSIWHHAQQ